MSASADGVHAVKDPFHLRTWLGAGATLLTKRPCSRVTVVAAWLPVTSPARAPVKLTAAVAVPTRSP